MRITNYIIVFEDYSIVTIANLDGVLTSEKTNKLLDYYANSPNYKETHCQVIDVDEVLLRAMESNHSSACSHPSDYTNQQGGE